MQQLFAYTAITNWSLQRSGSLFIAWYEIVLIGLYFMLMVALKGYINKHVR